MVKVGLASIVLPVMGVNAFGWVVFSEVEGTEHSFVVKHVEIIVLCVVVDKCGQDLFFAMGVGAEVLVGTFVDVVGVVVAEIFFIFLEAVVLLYD